MTYKYKVGYAKPPPSTQFKKGQSGNPKGRPKKETQNRELFGNILNAPLTVELDGQKTKMQPYEIAIRRVLKRTMKQKKPKDIIYMIRAFEEQGFLFLGKKSRDAMFKKPDGTIVKMEGSKNN